MLGIPCKFDRNLFAIIHPPLVGWLRRAVPVPPKVRDRLFVYFSIENGTFVVGLWTDRWKRAFFDVVNMGQSLHFTPEDALHIRQLLGQPLSRAELARRSYDSYTARMRQRQEDGDEAAEKLYQKMRPPKVQVGYGD